MFAAVRHALETLPPVQPFTAPQRARTGFELHDGDDLDAVLAGLVASHTGAPLGVGELLRQRPRWVEIVDDPGLIGNVVEELFRVRPPVPTVERAGLTLDIAAANRDPEMFRSPNRIEPLRRRASRHLSFGAGPHACPGRAQATAEAIALLHELTRRYPGLRLVDEVAPHPVVDVG